MFQFWKLVLLCGLLTGTSASIFGKVGRDIKNGIDKGRDVLEDKVRTVGANLKEDLSKLQNSALGQQSAQVFQKAENLLAGAVSKALALENILGLKINNVHLLNVKAKLTSDKKGLEVTFPVSADISLDPPSIGKIIDVSVSLELLSGVSIETKDGIPRGVAAQCSLSPNSISLSLLGGRSELLNVITNAESAYLSQTLSSLVESQVCPLVTVFINSLGAKTFQGAIDALVKGIHL